MVLMCIYYKRVQDFFFVASVSVEAVALDGEVVLSLPVFDGSELLGVVTETLVLPSAVGITVFSSV